MKIYSFQVYFCTFQPDKVLEDKMSAWFSSQTG